MKHRLTRGERILLTIKAREHFSAEVLDVQAGEEYHIWCEGKQYWVDMFIPASANGYPNPIANLVGQRVKGVRCFCLCGAYNNDDTTGFEIGKERIVKCVQDGELSFFANDVPGFDWNNWGKLLINVKMC